jgi:hypothetical protein
MNNIKIFRANPGEGKTKWLFERAVEESLNGKHLYYVGTERSMEALTKMWEATFHEKCPIINWCESKGIVEPCCIFTDEMFENLRDMDLWLNFMQKYGATWYITVDKEYFVN